MKELRQRKRIRLKEYDYSSPGQYYITICVKEKHEVLGEIKGMRANEIGPCLSEIGAIVENEILKLSRIYENIFVDKYIIMPHHIHMIIVLTCGRTQFAPTVSQVIKQFKGSITKQIGFSIWQRSYFDHIIRDKEEYKAICQYIDTNPLKWEIDRFYESIES